jgi:hypothetical protein
LDKISSFCPKARFASTTVIREIGMTISLSAENFIPAKFAKYNPKKLIKNLANAMPLIFLKAKEHLNFQD